MLVRATLFGGAILHLAAGCSSPSNTGGSSLASGAGCTPELGSYLVHLVGRAGGTCLASPPDQIVGVDVTRSMMGMLPPGCAGQDSITLDYCTETTNETCIDTAANRKTVVTGSIRYSADGASGTGIWQITITDTIVGTFICQSIYDVTVKRQ